MKLRQLLTASTLILAVWTLSGGAAQAETVLYDGISLFQGQQAFTDSFTLATPGTLTLTRQNIPWLAQLSDLTGFLSTSSGVVGTTIGAGGAGTESLSLAAGTYSAHWFGDAQGTYNLGVVGMTIAFQPTTPATLPGSLLLLVSGLGRLFGWQGRREPILASF